MILRLDASDLRAILRPLSKVGAENIVIDLSESSAYGVASDMGLLVRDTKLIAEGAGEKFCLGSQDFLAVTGSLQGAVELRKDGNSLNIKAGRAKFQLATKPVPADDAVAFEFPPKAALVDMKVLKEALRFLSPIPGGKQFDWSGSVSVKPFEISATDGARIAQVVTAHGPDPFLLPVKAVPLIEDLAGDVAISVGSNTVLFRSEGRTLFVRQLAKKYPDTSAIWPKNVTRDYSLDTEAFRQSLRSVQTCVPASDHYRVILVLDGDGIQLSAHTETGNAEADLDAEITYPDAMFNEVEQIKLSLNSQFLQDFVANLKEKKFLFRVAPANDISTERLVVLEAGNKKTLIALLG